jgi:DNA-binding MarR family transcriptional regulator
MKYLRVQSVAMGGADEDLVDVVLREWRGQRPELDLGAVAVIARLGRAAELTERGLDEVFREYGLNRSSFDVLATLRRGGPPYRRTPTELYRAHLRTSGAMTHMIDRLERDSLVERLPDPSDRRGLLVGLTPKGRQLVDRVVPRHLANEERLLATLSASERRQLAKLLRKLLIDLEEPRS